MPQMSKIEQSGLAPLVAELSRSKTNAEIAKILKDEHGLDVCMATVRTFTGQIRREQGQLNREAIEGAIAPTVAHDISVLDRAIDKLALWFDDEGLRVSERLLVVRELRQVIATKLSNAGGDSAERVADAVAAFAVLATRALEGPPEDVGE